MICLTLVSVITAGVLALKKNGSQLVKPDLAFINMSSFAGSIGFSVYAFEGIGIILPIQDIAADQGSFRCMVFATIISTASLYIFFGNYSLNAFGVENKDKALVTSFLSIYFNETVADVILVLFMTNLFFTYPLQLYPAHIIVESYLYIGWPKSRKRMMWKNVSRSTLVIITVVFTLSLGEKIDKFLSLLGAIACTPIAFTLPAAFHLKACAKTAPQKAADVIVILFSIAVGAYCAVFSIQHWND